MVATGLQQQVAVDQDGQSQQARCHPLPLPKSQPCCAYELDQSLNLQGIVSTQICVASERWGYAVTGVGMPWQQLSC